jgi:hypothetical protein
MNSVLISALAKLAPRRRKILLQAVIIRLMYCVLNSDIATAYIQPDDDSIVNYPAGAYIIQPGEETARQMPTCLPLQSHHVVQNILTSFRHTFETL